jgi:hypothetical protein
MIRPSRQYGLYCYLIFTGGVILQTTVSAFSPILLSRTTANARLAAPILFHDFDFSSTLEWNNFYEDGKGFEWHSNIPLERVASYIPEDSDCLMVGCGDSELPSVTLSTRRSTRLNLLDSSNVCIEQLRELYGNTVDYTCGDATKMSSLFPESKKFDIVVDKGLTDALLCNEGWDYFLEKLLAESSKILKPGLGMYLLISYRLSKSHKEFLQEVGETVGLDWEFDLPDSTERISVSIGRKR